LAYPAPLVPRRSSDALKLLSVPALLVCVEGSASDEDARACREQFEMLVQRAWTYRPSFVDQVDEVRVTQPGDLPVLRTVGVVVALPDTDEGADEDAVRHDVVALVDSMSGLAQRAGIEFVVEYGEEAVGFLDGGVGDARFVASFFGDS
jgi:hypothetical protein